MCDQFVVSWPLVECWDGWRGVRIGSPVVVVALGCRGTTLALCGVLLKYC
ncbi:hypothetical protein [Streptomyces sp. NPDC049813]